jgi:translation initiation factor 2 alpha subunit (eIF-2alpha)
MDSAKNVLNSVNIEKVKVVTDLYSAMGDLMKADNSKFNKLMERVEETFGNLVDALNNNTKATEENSVATQTDSQEVIVENAEKEQKAKETKPQQPAQQSGPQSIDVNIRINGEDISDGSTLVISKQ